MTRPTLALLILTAPLAACHGAVPYPYAPAYPPAYAYPAPPASCGSVGCGYLQGLQGRSVPYQPPSQGITNCLSNGFGGFSCNSY